MHSHAWSWQQGLCNVRAGGPSSSARLAERGCKLCFFSRRYQRTHADDNHYAHPIDFVPIVDLNAGKVGGG